MPDNFGPILPAQSQKRFLYRISGGLHISCYSHGVPTQRLIVSFDEFTYPFLLRLFFIHNARMIMAFLPVQRSSQEDLRKKWKKVEAPYHRFHSSNWNQAL